MGARQADALILLTVTSQAVGDVTVSMLHLEPGDAKATTLNENNIFAWYGSRSLDLQGWFVANSFAFREGAVYPNRAGVPNIKRYQKIPDRERLRVDTPRTKPR